MLCDCVMMHIVFLSHEGDRHGISGGKLFPVSDGAMIFAEDDVAWCEGLCFMCASCFRIFTQSACKKESAIAEVGDVGRKGGS